MPNLQNSKATLDYLNTIGSKDRGDNIVMGNSAKALVRLSEILINRARKNLEKGGHNATGDTSSSMKATDIKTQGTKLELDIELLSTYKFLDKGVKGTKGGRGKYKFKTDFPSKKMVDAIQQWAKRRSVVSKYKAKSKRERTDKAIKQSEADRKRSVAYAMARSIKMKGIDPTNFFSEAVEYTKKQQKKIYADAFRIDIIESLKNN